VQHDVSKREARIAKVVSHARLAEHVERAGVQDRRVAVACRRGRSIDDADREMAIGAQQGSGHADRSSADHEHVLVWPRTHGKSRGVQAMWRRPSRSLGTLDAVRNGVDAAVHYRRGTASVPCARAERASIEAEATGHVDEAKDAAYRVRLIAGGEIR